MRIHKVVHCYYYGDFPNTTAKSCFERNNKLCVVYSILIARLRGEREGEREVVGTFVLYTYAGINIQTYYTFRVEIEGAVPYL